MYSLNVLVTITRNFSANGLFCLEILLWLELYLCFILYLYFWPSIKFPWVTGKKGRLKKQLPVVYF